MRYKRLLAPSSEGPATIKDLHAANSEKENAGSQTLPSNREPADNCAMRVMTTGDALVSSVEIEHDEPVPISIAASTIRTATSSATIAATVNNSAGCSSAI